MPSLRQSKLIPSGLARPSGALIRIRLFLAVFGGLLLATLPLLAASAQQATDAFITVSYGEPINVRAGPSSFDYPIIGILPKDGTAPAIGRSPKGEWIQIEFPSGPKGVGWVYAPNVSLSSESLLPVVEPPPTATPATTPTINPTYAAALAAVPTSTRKPTFTAPPPLQLSTYVNPDPTPSGGVHTGWIIVGLGAVGLLGMAISSLRRK
jgi:uncharacterized protein YraI